MKATGKHVLLDKHGKQTFDVEACVKKLPVFTDDETLTTLMAAAAKAGPRVKAREDHDDSIGARAGFADVFKLAGDRVVADIHLFDSYRNRKTVLETARETPGEIGLSIDFTPEFKLMGDHALMRVKELHAVDIVDEGAITPGGLLLSAGVDTDPQEVVTEQNSNSPTMPAPTNEEIMSAVGKLAETVSQCVAQMAKLSAPAAAPAAPAEVETEVELKALKATTVSLAASVKEASDRANESVKQLAQFKKERALLGFKGTDAERTRLAAGGSVEDIEAANASAKSYTDLVADYRAKNSAGAGAAHDAVQKTEAGKAAYRLHLASKGVTGRMNG